MQIKERSVGDVIILDLKGRLALGDGDETLKDKINSLVNRRQNRIVLNLAGVPSIDSAGVGELVRSLTTVTRRGGSLRLVNLTKRVTGQLVTAKLLRVFEPGGYAGGDDGADSPGVSASVRITLPNPAPEDDSD